MTALVGNSMVQVKCGPGSLGFRWKGCTVNWYSMAPDVCHHIHNTFNQFVIYLGTIDEWMASSTASKFTEPDNFVNHLGRNLDCAVDIL